MRQVSALHHLVLMVYTTAVLLSSFLLLFTLL
jgi:hypothetical protein